MCLTFVWGPTAWPLPSHLLAWPVVSPPVPFNRPPITGRELNFLREALRNVREHAKASEVSVVVTPQRAIVRDNGRGFDATERGRRRDEGHVGLTLLQDLVMQSGGFLTVMSQPGAGTTVELELPR